MLANYKNDLYGTPGIPPEAADSYNEAWLDGAIVVLEQVLKILDQTDYGK